MKKKELLGLIHDLQNQVANLRYEILRLQAQLEGKQDRPIYIPSVWPVVDGTPDLCSDGGQHDYPFPWHATIPPNCKKCGKQGQSFTVTCSTPVDDQTTFVEYVGCRQCAEDRKKSGTSLSPDILSKLGSKL